MIPFDCKRRELLKKIIERCEQYKSSAEYDAMKLARNPTNLDLQRDAAVSVAKADVIKDAKMDIITLINAYWPNREDVENNDHQLIDDCSNGTFEKREKND